MDSLSEHLLCQNIFKFAPASMASLSEHSLCQNIFKFLGIRLGLRFCVRLTWICWNTVKYYWINNCSFFLTEWNCWPITPWLGEEKRRVTSLSQSEKKITLREKYQNLELVLVFIFIYLDRTSRVAE